MRGRFLSAALPRLVAAAWSVWAYATAYAYLDGPPATLEMTQYYLPISISAAWSVAATLALVGALVPPSRLVWLQILGATLRGLGLAITAGLLTVWGIEFVAGEMNRGWVSGKNYWMLALAALAACWYVGQDAPREVATDD